MQHVNQSKPKLRMPLKRSKNGFKPGYHTNQDEVRKTYQRPLESQIERVFFNSGNGKQV